MKNTIEMADHHVIDIQEEQDQVVLEESFPFDERVQEPPFTIKMYSRRQRQSKSFFERLFPIFRKIKERYKELFHFDC